MTDEQIIGLYWDRNEQAITESNASYGTYCYTIAHNILSNHMDSEECVNDTWLKSWNTIPPTRPNILKTFFGKITRNLSLDRYRANHAQKRGEGEMPCALEELAECVPGNSDVEAEITAQELGSDINVFLHTLPDRECDIFLRRYFFVESTSEIAARYEMKERNVLVILSRTRKKLQSYLEQKGYTV